MERGRVSRVSQLAKSCVYCKIITVVTSHHLCFILFIKSKSGLPWWRSVKNLPGNAGDTG